ncbi:MAG: neutral zinc metallopeptidase [Actinomycetia bacterium]|nr:neutral zinc metallopeptidase [Actinomycetes bacterium]
MSLPSSSDQPGDQHQPGSGPSPVPPDPHGGAVRRPGLWRSLGTGLGGGTLAGLVVLLALVAGSVLSSRPVQQPDLSAEPTPTSVRKHPHDYTYRNERYEVPSVPNQSVPLPEVPQSQAEDLRTGNPIYSQTMTGPNACPYDATDMHSREQVQQVMNQTIGCLMAAWEGPVKAAGYELPRPAFILAGANLHTPCATMRVDDFAGLYCPVNQTIYLSLGERTEERADGIPTYTVEAILAHEFGHHVQARTGLLDASRYVQANASGRSEELQENRRVELQADCFSGLGVSTLSQSWSLTPEDMELLERNRAARHSETHGNRSNRPAWFRKGYDARGGIGACNTFAASADEVA